jgi:ABC-2 type transport system ATP-binding protein
MSILLEIQHLKKQFATHLAVNDISFTLQKGSIFGLLGPNGAGKTTLIRMITGIFHPDQGKIMMNGKVYHPEKDPSRIGYMPEERGLYKKMKVGEQILYLAQLKGLSKQEAMEKAKYWFEKLDMTKWWHKKVEDLSKGMSQKLQFVATIMHEPDLIILDEPFSGLDPLNAEIIKKEIFELASKGASIIFSTHRMEQVEEICDHIVLVNQGKKILDGTVSDVKQQFKKNTFLIDATPNTAATTGEKFQVLNHQGSRWEIKCDPDFSTNELLLHFINDGKQILGFKETLPSLNEIFIQLVASQKTSENHNQ